MSARDAILAELRAGERTTSQLLDAAGVSRNAVLLQLAALNRSGYTIANVAGEDLVWLTDGRLFVFSSGRGGHHDARWRLVYDLEHPVVRVCNWPGCTIQLSRTNTGPYCRPHKLAVARLLLACVDVRLDRKEVEADAQLAVL